MQVKFTVPEVPNSLNTVLRMHWLARKKLQEYWDTLVFAEWINHDRMIFSRPVKITYTITFLSKRARDLDNYLGGTKYITDALKRTFFLKDDADWLRDIRAVFCRGSAPQTEILIEEVDNV